MLDFLVTTKRKDYIFSLVEDKFNSGDTDGFMQEMFKILFRVGLVGLKPDSFAAVYWSYHGQKLLTAEIDPNTRVHIHPAFWRVLGVSP